MSSDFNNASEYAHRKNIERYQRLLKTYLSDIEREFIERRIDEEKKALRQSVQAAGLAIAQMQRDSNLTKAPSHDDKTSSSGRHVENLRVDRCHYSRRHCSRLHTLGGGTQMRGADPLPIASDNQRQ